MDKNRKVAFVAGSLRMGGAERMMVNLANELCAKADVYMILLTPGDDLVSELDPAVRLIHLNRKRTLNAFMPLRKFLKDEKPDVLISTQIHVNLFCMALKGIFKIPVKIILREATTPGVHFRLNSSFRNSITRKLMLWLYPKADAVVVNAAAAREDVITNRFVPAEKVKLIYNPVINSRFMEKRKAEYAHRFFGSAPVFISVGRLAPAKNFSLLLHAFAKVLEHRDARLILVGEGEERKKLEALIERLNIRDKADLTGQIANPLPLVRQSDVFVLSSTYEGSPNSLIEAMACGTQVVSTAGAGGASEILMQGALGALVPVNDIEAMTIAMEEALNKKVDRETLMKSAERFDASKSGSEYFSLVEVICNTNEAKREA